MVGKYRMLRAGRFNGLTIIPVLDSLGGETEGMLMTLSPIIELGSNLAIFA
jgi:hypothetical protein